MAKKLQLGSDFTIKDGRIQLNFEPSTSESVVPIKDKHGNIVGAEVVRSGPQMSPASHGVSHGGPQSLGHAPANRHAGRRRKPPE